MRCLNDLDELTWSETELERYDLLYCDGVTSSTLEPLVSGSAGSSTPRLLCIGETTLQPGGAIAIDTLPYPLHPRELVTAITNEGGQAQAAIETLPSFSLEDPVLLVEDNAVNQEVLLGMLETLGLSAIVADDGPAALAQCERRNFPVILMDCGLPDMDGYTVTGALREGSSPNRTTTIIALTANNLSGERDRCLAAGINDFLAKPCSLEDLGACLEHWLPTDAATPARSETASPKERTREAFERGAAANEPMTDDSAADVIELAALEQILRLERNGRQGMLDKVVSLYVKDLGSTLETLTEALANGNHEAARAMAHKMKSSTANLGAFAYAETWSDLETALEAGQEQATPALLTALKHRRDGVINGLQQALAQLRQTA